MYQNGRTPQDEGGYPLGPPPPFSSPSNQLTAKILLLRLRCQEDLSFKLFRLAFGDHRGTLGGRGSQPNPFTPPPLQTPAPPLLIHRLQPFASPLRSRNRSLHLLRAVEHRPEPTRHRHCVGQPPRHVGHATDRRV